MPSQSVRPPLFGSFSATLLVHDLVQVEAWLPVDRSDPVSYALNMGELGELVPSRPIFGTPAFTKGESPDNQMKI